MSELWCSRVLRSWRQFASPSRSVNVKMEDRNSMRLNALKTKEKQAVENLCSNMSFPLSIVEAGFRWNESAVSVKVCAVFHGNL